MRQNGALWALGVGVRRAASRANVLDVNPNSTSVVTDVTADSPAQGEPKAGGRPGTLRLARSRSFGEPDRVTPDPGLFGPDSISWRVHADVIAGVGGVRAILMQGLLPDAVDAIVAHSNYREDPWGRLFRTAEYIGVITYGTTSEAERAGAVVRGIHRRLQLDDPAWLMWVHASFTDSLLSTALRAGVKLSRPEQDAYVEEQRVAARLVGLEPSDVPDSVASMKSYIDDMRPTLYANRTARDIAKFVLVPPMPRRASLLTPARPAWVGVAGTAFALLPAWARRLYGGPLFGLPVLGTAVADTQATVAVRALRHGLLALPERTRRGPHVEAAQARLGLN